MGFYDLFNNQPGWSWCCSAPRGARDFEDSLWRALEALFGHCLIILALGRGDFGGCSRSPFHGNRGWARRAQENSGPGTGRPIAPRACLAEAQLHPRFLGSSVVPVCFVGI